MELEHAHRMWSPVPGSLCLGTGSWTVWGGPGRAGPRLGTIQRDEVGLVVAVNAGKAIDMVMIAWASGLIGWSLRGAARPLFPARDRR